MTTIDDVISYLIWASWWLTSDEMEEIIEHRAVFKKYIDFAVANVRVNLANMNMQWNEWMAYMTKEVLFKLKDDMDNSVENFRIMIEEKKRKEQAEILAE